MHGPLVSILFKREGKEPQVVYASCRSSAKSILLLKHYLPTNHEETEWVTTDLSQAEIVSAEEDEDGF